MDGQHLVADPAIAPGDARELLHERVDALAADLAAARAEKRKAARLELGPLEE